MLHELITSVSPENATQLLQGVVAQINETQLPAHVLQSIHSFTQVGAPLMEQGGGYTEPPAWVVLGAAFGLISLAQAGNIIWLGLKNRRK